MQDMKREDPGFDLDRALQYAADFRRATGIPAMVIDAEGNPLSGAVGHPTSCGFCSLIRKFAPSLSDCTRAHRYGSYQAERFGGRYIFFCPLSMVHWVSPISIEGVVRGALVGGPVLLIDPEEFLRDELSIRLGVSPQDIPDLSDRVREVPYVEPERVTSLSELLFALAVLCSSAGGETWLREREELDQQSAITEYIAAMKRRGRELPDIGGYPVEKERELLALISDGDRKGAGELLNEILGYVLFASGGDIAIVRQRVLELAVLLSRGALEGGADAEEVFGLNYRSLRELDLIRNVEDLAAWLSRIMNRFTDCVFHLKEIRHADVIMKATRYVKRAYRERISLEQVSSYVGLSPSYFSRIFKQETGSAWSTYVNRIRVDRARRLLISTSVPLSDIAGMVGFEDQSYFTKVFKRITGLSPGRYRESPFGRNGRSGSNGPGGPG